MARSFRLTYPTAAVLLAIRSGHRYGFDIMDVTGLPDGTVYPILRRLEDRGAVRGVWEPEAEALAERRPPRRYYELTPEGLETVREAAETFPALGQVIGAAEGAVT